MSLGSFEFKASYNKADDDIAEGFYLPCMRTSIRYDRISGYFGSTIYIIAWNALKKFINNGGRMRVICSPIISDDDENALNEGYSARNNELLANAIKKEVERLFASSELYVPARLLAYLVSEEIIDIKIAVPGSNAGADAKRMFHDKVGVFSDGDLSVGFRGSMNETFKGLSSDGNIESIDVFPSWADGRDRERLDTAEDFFARLWDGVIPGVAVYSFPSEVRAVLRDKAKGADWEQLLEEIQVTQNLANKWKPDKRPYGNVPREHQTNALEAWVLNGRRGIFEHATGSGKTFTAMCAIRNALDREETVIVLVPSRDLLGQWHDELTRTIGDIEVYYLLCGDGHIEWRQGSTLTSWTSPSFDQNRVIISTMDTAASPGFLRKVSQGSHLFMVADEVHRLGSLERRKIFSLDTGARLGLSATPRRHGDQIGTDAIMDYFKGIIQPPFTLEDAILAGVLTKYFYYPQRLSLTEDEQVQWDEITEEVSKLFVQLKSNNDLELSPRLKMLLINRARIVKNAEGKVPLALDVLRKHFKPGQRWIVYCDNINQLKAVLNNAMAEGFDTYEYYAGMAGDRDMTIAYFEDNGGVLVSIKCLDEGVDIPSTTHALILASSQNPREFIQRRGRILRRAKGKHFAELYDAITMPILTESEDEKSLSIITAELSRAIQFGESAENYSGVTDLKNIAAEFQIDYNKLTNGGLEDDDE